MTCGTFAGKLRFRKLKKHERRNRLCRFLKTLESWKIEQEKTDLKNIDTPCWFDRKIGF